MENSMITKAFLAISGLIGIGVGGALLFEPVAFEASAGIHLGEDINLLSEMRAAGGTVLVAGLIIGLGAFISKMTYISVALSSLLYLSYGISRIIGMIIDGLPNSSLVAVTVVEIVIGVLSILLLLGIGRTKATLQTHVSPALK